MSETITDTERAEARHIVANAVNVLLWVKPVTR